MVKMLSEYFELGPDFRPKKYFWWKMAILGISQTSLTFARIHISEHIIPLFKSTFEMLTG